MAVLFLFRGHFMIEGYLTISEVAEIWQVTPRRVRAMCLKGQIDGASKLGREWAVPINAEKPTDGRVTTGEYKNWRKAKKI